MRILREAKRACADKRGVANDEVVLTRHDDRARANRCVLEAVDDDRLGGDGAVLCPRDDRARCATHDVLFPGKDRPVVPAHLVGAPCADVAAFIREAVVLAARDRAVVSIEVMKLPDGQRVRAGDLVGLSKQEVRVPSQLMTFPEDEVVRRAGEVAHPWTDHQVSKPIAHVA